MRESIEKKREMKPSEAVVTAMSHDRSHLLGRNSSVSAREDAASLSGFLAVISGFVSDASSQLGLLTLVPQLHLSRDRTRSRSLSHREKFSAEERTSLSALVDVTASPNTRSPQAVVTVITTKTEQRRCAAA